MHNVILLSTAGFHLGLGGGGGGGQREGSHFFHPGNMSCYCLN